MLTFFYFSIDNIYILRYTLYEVYVMRNPKGITMVSLVIYIVAFSIILGIVATVTTFFSNNIDEFAT